jgi:hypothetical protein
VDCCGIASSVHDEAASYVLICAHFVVGRADCLGFDPLGVWLSETRIRV